MVTDHRQIIKRFYRLFAIKDIAATLGVPIGTVKSRIARGRAMLATAFHHLEGPPEERQPGNPPPASRRPTESP